MSKTPYLSVVIPTYNRLETLGSVLSAFSRQSIPTFRFEVIVVDSLSDDGTQAFMDEFLLDSGFRCRYIRQENRGRAGARNRGIREAAGEIIVFLDSDIVPESHFLAAHSDFHVRRPGCAAVGWESRIDSLSLLSEVRSHPEKQFRIHPPKEKKLSWLYFLTGNASVSRQRLLDIGLFDESFCGYGFEDLELGYRLLKAGTPIYYLPEAVNYHVHRRTLENQYEIERLAGRNAVRFYRKHGDWRIRWLLGMHPLAFAWHRMITGWLWLFHFLEARARRNGRGDFASRIMTQYHYLSGVKNAWHLEK